MADKTVTDNYIITLTAKLVGDDAFTHMANKIKALEKANRELKKETGGVATTMKNTTTATNNAAAGMGRTSSLIQNLSYQFTDFAVQVQGGVTQLRAFSQQAPQVAGALGAAGIGGAAGAAALGIAAITSALAPMIIAFFKGADAIKVAQTELDRLDLAKLDLSDFIKDAGKTNDELYNLTEQGKQFAISIDLINKSIEKSKTREFLNIVKGASDGIADFVKEIDTAQRQLDSVDLSGGRQAQNDIKYWEGIIKDLSNQVDESYGIVGSLAPLFAKSLETMFKGGKEGSVAATRLLKMLEQTSNLSDDAAENVTILRDAIKGLFEQGFFGNLGTTADDQADKLTKAKNAWKAYTDAIRTPNQVLADTLAAIRQAGEAAGATEEQIQLVLDAAYRDYDESAFDRLAKDADTMTGGINAANAALKKLNVNQDYLYGIRLKLAETDIGSKQYQTLVDLLGDAATPIEKINSELGKIQDKSAGIDQLRKSFEEFKKSFTGDPKDLEQLEKNLGLTAKKVLTEWEKVGEALGEGLVDSVGSFVDAMFDAEADFSDVIDSMLKNLAKLIIEMQIAAALEAGLKGTFLDPNKSSSGSGSSNGRVLSPVPQNSNVVQLARSPFTRTAQAYSSGPLISSSIGGSARSGTTVNVINNTNAQIDVSEKQNSTGGVSIDMMINNAVDSAISRGRFDKTFNNTFGMKRRGT